MLAIVDLDSVVYAAAGTAQSKNEDGIMEYAPLSHALQSAKRSMESILEHTGCHDYRAFLTESNDENSFRKAIYPEYKANRKDMERPFYYNDVREYFIQHWDAEVVGTIEADDAVCMVQHSMYEGNFMHKMDKAVPAILCGVDKDLDQIPGMHYNYRTMETYWMTELDGLKCLYFQMLAGDRADNIPRIKKGWREKGALEKIQKAETERELYEIVYEEFIATEFDDGKNTYIEERIKWLGDLLYLRKHDKDEYRIPSEKT